MAVFISGPALAPALYDAAFSANSWEKIISACQQNKVPETWAIGDSKAMTINGADYLVDIIGKNHDSYSDGTGEAPLTFQLRSCYATDNKMNGSHTNAGGWGACNMRTTHLPAILALMPSEVRTGIRQVNKLTGVQSIINTTADKLFLLSEVEIFGTAGYSTSGEGTQYAYYAANNGTVKYKSGVSTNWGARSPMDGNGDSFCAVNTSGGADVFGAADAIGVAFAFCF